MLIHHIVTAPVPELASAPAQAASVAPAAPIAPAEDSVRVVDSNSAAPAVAPGGSTIPVVREATAAAFNLAASDGISATDRVGAKAINDDPSRPRQVKYWCYVLGGREVREVTAVVPFQ